MICLEQEINTRPENFIKVLLVMFEAFRRSDRVSTSMLKPSPYWTHLVTACTGSSCVYFCGCSDSSRRRYTASFPRTKNGQRDGADFLALYIGKHLWYVYMFKLLVFTHKPQYIKAQNTTKMLFQCKSLHPKN